MPTLGTSITSASDPAWMQTRISEAEARQALGSLTMPKPGSTLSYRSGVHASGPVSGTTRATAEHGGMLVAAGGGLTVTVAFGNCQIDTPSGGPYLCTWPSTQSFSLAAVSGSQNRYDLVVARIYDDRNSAIASGPNDRRFAVQVITGDNSSGTPTSPEAFLPTNGWIPLARIYLAAGATSPTTITNLRGPGLVGRGGIRPLTGTDAASTSAAFLEAGAYPGDRRWVHSAPFPDQAYFSGSSDPLAGGWQGVVNCIRYFAAAPPGETARIEGFGALQEICRVSITYPGTPYFIYPTGKVSATLDANCAADLRITLTSTVGPDVNWTRFATYGASGAKICVPSLAPMHYGPLTADSVVVLSVGMRDNVSGSSGFTYRGNDTGANTLSCLVFPAIPTA
jgi:hypothetical protein